MPYIIKSVIQNIYREKWINLLSIFAIGSSLLILLITFIFVYNFHLVTNRLPELFSMVVYLKDNLSKDETEKLLTQIKGRDYVAGLKYLSKADALIEFKKTVKGAGTILEGLDENPLSSYIEIKLKKEYVSKTALEDIAGEIKKMEGVDEVYYGEKIAETIYYLKKSSQAISIFLFIIVSIIVIFISYSTVKILFFRKKDEIDILKLLGATDGFIRSPFVFEGLILGFLGGIIAIISTAMIYFLMKYKLGTIIPIFEGVILPWQIMPLCLLISLILGVIGSLIAVGRIRI